MFIVEQIVESFISVVNGKKVFPFIKIFYLAQFYMRCGHFICYFQIEELYKFANCIFIINRGGLGIFFSTFYSNFIGFLQIVN